MAQTIVTERGFSGSNFDPRNPILDQEEFEDYEELHPHEFEELEPNTIVLFAIRCLTVFVCLIGLILVLVNVSRGNKLKSWRLYFLVALSVFSWLAMTLYQDYIDEYFVGEVTRWPQSRSIYWVFRNFLHGFNIYLILLLMAHLSDMQHRSHWFGFIAGVILIPLAYAVGLLIVDLRLHIDTRKLWYVNIAITSCRVFFYNVLTTILLFAMSRSFCTSRLYGTYSEKRSKVVVVISRWTFAWLLIHNMVSVASYAIYVITLLPDTLNTAAFTLIHNALEEAVLMTLVISVPMSYLFGTLAQCCCGVSQSTEMEMDKVDKIYTDVWTTPSLRNNGAASTTPSRPSSATASTGMQNGVVARRNHGSNSTLSSIDSLGELPRSVATNPGGSANNDRRKRVRESYMEAVSTGSLNDDRSSMTSDPVEL